MNITTRSIMAKNAGHNRRLSDSEIKALSGNQKLQEEAFNKISSYYSNYGSGYSMRKRETRNDIPRK